MNKFNTPTTEVICLTADEPGKFTQDNITNAIKYLRSLKVPTYEGTTEFDPEYPRLTWDGTNVTQTKSKTKPNTVIVNSVDEFVALFEPINVIHVENISERYSAKVYADRIEVGCQTISTEKFKELVKAAKNMGMIR
jgi:hypothetical protein